VNTRRQRLFVSIAGLSCVAAFFIINHGPFPEGSENLVRWLNVGGAMVAASIFMFIIYTAGTELGKRWPRRR